jgi:integrase
VGVNKWGKPGLWRHPNGQFYVVKTVGGRKGYHGTIKAAHGTEAFDREYWAIRTGKASPARRSWRALIASYRKTDGWLSLKARTRADYETVLIYIEDHNGDREVSRVTRADVTAAQDKNRHRTRFANYIGQVMSILCEHAMDIGWLTVNPVKGFKHLPVPADRKRPHIPWTDAAVAKARAEMLPFPLLVLELGIGTVQRPGDLVGFTWGDFDGDTLRLVQNKTDVALVLPCTDALRAALIRHKAALPYAPHPAQPILANADGSRMTDRKVAAIFMRERKRLGLQAHDLHALRYRGVAELAWAKCTDEEIAAYSGHMSLEMVRKYAGPARQIMRARQAKEKRQ